MANQQNQDPIKENPGIDWSGLKSFWTSFKNTVGNAVKNNKTVNALVILTGFTLSTVYKVSGPLALGLCVSTMNIKGCVNPFPPTPQPDPPVPNPPTPPNPPGPPAPIVGEGLRVLITFDDKKVTQIPEEQQAILHSKAVRDYLDSKCPLGPDGKTKEYRFYPNNIPKNSIDKKWADAMARPTTSDLWMIVSNGKTGWEGPLPKNVNEAMTIFKKYGGN